MAFLEQFSAEDRELIVSIPYRAGLWVSKADAQGGADADEKELETLKEIIAEKSSGMFESAFVHEVMAETFARQGDWKKWSQNLETVLADCSKAVELVSGKLNAHDVDGYRMHVMVIGLDVAKAFREFDQDAGFFAKLIGDMKLYWESLVRFIKRDTSLDMESVFNISYEEDVALSQLAQALHPETA